MDIINIILYIAIAFSGTVFGSFFTLAVHRIPKHQDITHERSYCPKCNHKLQFLDLIPVFSYIFLGGKCRYCGEKIRPRYLILELCSGAFFLALAFARGINIDTFYMLDKYWQNLVFYIIDILFVCAIFIIAGIDKEYKKIPNSLIIYGFIVCIIRVIIDIIICNLNGNSLTTMLIERLIGFGIPFISMLLIIAYSKIRKVEKTAIGMGDLKYLSILGLYFGISEFVAGLFATMIIILFVLIYTLLVGIAKKEKDAFKKNIKDIEIPLGFYLAIPFSILMIILPIF